MPKVKIYKSNNSDYNFVEIIKPANGPGSKDEKLWYIGVKLDKQLILTKNEPIPAYLVSVNAQDYIEFDIDDDAYQLIKKERKLTLTEGQLASIQQLFVTKTKVSPTLFLPPTLASASSVPSSSSSSSSSSETAVPAAASSSAPRTTKSFQMEVKLWGASDKIEFVVRNKDSDEPDFIMDPNVIRRVANITLTNEQKYVVSIRSSSHPLNDMNNLDRNDKPVYTFTTDLTADEFNNIKSWYRTRDKNHVLDLEYYAGFNISEYDKLAKERRNFYNNSKRTFSAKK